ncbi:hypothetical protein HYX07_00150 [Candidatus Woesearchaeota archaeon]|nr:hypothetical protein [Candidatus Woesearchaeota archaeon]
MTLPILPIIVGAVIAYLVVMVILHKFLEKFFMMLFFAISALFVIAVLYFMLKGF